MEASILQDENWNKFLAHLKQECRKNKVKLDLRKTQYLKLSDKIKCGGFFESEEKPRLVCAIKNDEWPSLLIHEFCHMNQWLEDKEGWEKASNSFVFVDTWLEGKRVKEIEKHIDFVKNLELDAEKRVIQTIENWSLNINIEEYTRKANAYILFYLFLKKTRKWSKPGNASYTNPRILRSVSPNFDMNYDFLSPEIEKLFIEEKI